jgi:hypothetical protein
LKTKKTLLEHQTRNLDVRRVTKREGLSMYHSNTGRLLLSAVFMAVAGGTLFAEEPVSSADNWWNSNWKKREVVGLDRTSAGWVQIRLPANARPRDIRCVLRGSRTPLPHWTQTIEMNKPVRVAASREAHFGFPRMIRTKNGDLVLFYRVGQSHAYDRSSIAIRRSTDDGKSWTTQRILRTDVPGYSAHNPVPLLTAGGRIVLWVSRYEFAKRPTVRHAGVWASSNDDGKTWSKFTRFDADTTRSSYYITDAIRTSFGLLAGSATFPPSGVGNCYVQIWHSADDGKTWAVRSNLTLPEENLGDEVALFEMDANRVLCLLRDRRRKDIYRLWSTDGGKTWSKRERLRNMFDCAFQRPVLTRINKNTFLVTGRDMERRQTVAYVSRDGCRTFGERHVLDTYQRDGAYTSGVLVDKNTVLLTWYSDEGSAALKPDIKLARLTIHETPQSIWVQLPEKRSANRLDVYFDNAAATASESRAKAFLKPGRFVKPKTQ